MYTFSNKLRTTAIVLMMLGLVGIVYGFLTAPKTIEDVEKIVAESHHGGGHEAAAEHKPEVKTIEAEAPATKTTEKLEHDGNPTTGIETDSTVIDSPAVAKTELPVAGQHDTTAAHTEEAAHEATAEAHGEEHAESAADAHADHEKHLHHVLQQLQ